MKLHKQGKKEEAVAMLRRSKELAREAAQARAVEEEEAAAAASVPAAEEVVQVDMTDPDIVELYAWMTPMGLDAYVPAMVGAGITSVAAAKGVPAEMISGWAGQVGLSTKQEQALLAAAASPGAGTSGAAGAGGAGS